uniref:Uncharacterized protein n=1 Tax=Nicotiana tabacum TaxID=4097 RepID=A0A1S3X8K5_TOBAC|nr:PREDICTED: uncharacterized protein LOC107762496 [Nicotiana tabacum]
MPNMKMWLETNNPSIEPHEPKPMSGRPKRCRRKSKDEPKRKYGKLSKNGVKMTCSKYHQLRHNRTSCKSVPVSTSNQPSQPTQQSQPIPPAPSRSFQTSNPPSMCNDTSAVKRSSQNQSTGIGRGGGRGLGLKRPRPAAGFGVYTYIRSGRTFINPGIPSERVIIPGTYKDTSATNIDLEFKPHGLKWKGENAVTTSQLQQMRAIRNIGSFQQSGSNMSSF